MKKVLFINHSSNQCGVYQWGIKASNALKNSKNLNLIYAECTNEKEFRDSITAANPSCIIYNYYPLTMPWLNAHVTKSILIPQLGTIHECTQGKADSLTSSLFNIELYLDPTIVERNNTIPIKAVPRLVLEYTKQPLNNPIITIGCFGFGMPNKGWVDLINRVNSEFDTAHIKLLMPFNSVVDSSGSGYSLPTAQRCREVQLKPNITLEIDHSFLPTEQVIEWLSKNDINAFLYHYSKSEGISSVIDYALAARRPLVITKANMFRHLHSCTPSICIEDRSIKEILDSGTSPLENFYKDWSEDSFIKFFESIILPL